jgi:subtilisin family serine protease
MNHSVLSKVLFGFNVLGVLAAEGAILTQFELFGSVLLVLHGVVVPLLALCASERHLDTGKGVVMGIQDIGFDLTHPNFYDSTATKYRIKRLWDQLSVDTFGSRFYVGKDYTSKRVLLRYAHSRDGESQTHGTHTLGIAAGSG